MVEIIKWDGRKISKPGIYSGVPMKAYHGDLCAGPSISATGLKQIQDCPLTYWSTSIYNEDRFQASDKAHFVKGRAIHALALKDEVFEDHFVISHFDSFRSKEAKAWKESMLAAGKGILTENDFEAIKGMAKALSESTIAMTMLDGVIEHTMVYQDEVTGLWFKNRPDVLPLPGAMSDLKTIATADYKSCMRAIIDFQYYMAIALTRMCARELLDMDTDVASLIFIESKPPVHHIFPMDIPPLWLEIGEAHNRDSMHQFAHGMKTGEWPGRADKYGGFPEAAVPAWAIERFERTGMI